MVTLYGGVQKNALPFDAIKDSFSKYIVRPANLFGLGGFAFDIERESSIALQAEITDHYIEDNTSVQDHIAVRPLRLSLTNYVGEVVDRQSGNDLTNGISKVVRKLTVLNAFLPKLSATATQTRNLITNNNAKRDFDTLTSNALDLYSLTKNLNPAADAQQQAYLYFEALLTQGILVSVQTPFKFLTNMAVESVTAQQGSDSKFISNFSITLKQIRKTSFQTVPFDPDAYSGRVAQQAEPQDDRGKVQGKPEDISILAKGLDLYRGIE